MDENTDFLDRIPDFMENFNTFSVVHGKEQCQNPKLKSLNSMPNLPNLSAVA